MTYTVREKYIWQLMWPQPDDALYIAQPDQYRSELYDRLASPLYPLAFAILTFMFLGPPQTTRQSRTLALVGPDRLSHGATPDRLCQRHCGRPRPIVLGLQFVALIAAILFGLWQISRGKTVEHGTLALRIVSAISDAHRAGDELRSGPMVDRHALTLFCDAVFQLRDRHLRRRGRACRHDRLFRIDAPRRRLAEGDGLDTRRDFACSGFRSSPSTSCRLRC